MTKQEEELAFFHELGLAVCNWNFVESGVYQIMTARANTNDHYALGFGFFAIDNFRAKLSFANAFLEQKLSATQRATWEVFATRLRKTVARRNRLAHDRVFFYEHGAPGRRYALEDWPTDRPRTSKSWPPKTPRDGALCLRDVVSCKRDFFYLHQDLENFHAALLGRKEPHSEVHERAENPPTIQAIARQMHEALGHPLKPSRRKSSARPSQATANDKAQDTGS